MVAFGGAFLFLREKQVPCYVGGFLLFMSLAIISLMI